MNRTLLPFYIINNSFVLMEMNIMTRFQDVFQKPVEDMVPVVVVNQPNILPTGIKNLMANLLVVMMTV